MGPVALGGQVSAERLRTQTAGATNYYANSSWGLAFNVSDDLSVSYSEARHVQSKNKKESHNRGNVSEFILADMGGYANEYTPKAWMHGKSLQVAYTLGGVGLKYAQTKYDNTAYGGFDSAKVPRESRIVAVSLAF